MPISHKYQTIFVHIPKTGGSSLDTALGIHGRDNRGSIKPCREILFGVENSRALQHLTILEIKKIIPPEIFKKYFKFAFVRNPYDKIVSEYFWQKKREKGLNKKEISFEKFILDYISPAQKENQIRHIFDDHYFPQHKFITDENGKIAVDFLGKFENLEADFQKACELGGFKASLPHLNKTKHGSYRDYYDEETKKLVSEIYGKDIEMFGYEF